MRDKPGEIWQGLASTFTQKQMNHFQRAELLLCIPDEAGRAKAEPVERCPSSSQNHAEAFAVASLES